MRQENLFIEDFELWNKRNIHFMWPEAQLYQIDYTWRRYCTLKVDIVGGLRAMISNVYKIKT